MGDVTLDYLPVCTMSTFLIRWRNQVAEAAIQGHSLITWSPLSPSNRSTIPSYTCFCTASKGLIVLGKNSVSCPAGNQHGNARAHAEPFQAKHSWHSSTLRKPLAVVASSKVHAMAKRCRLHMHLLLGSSESAPDQASGI